MSEMDIYDIIKWVFVPLAAAVTAHQYKYMNALGEDMKSKVSEERVRNIIEDKAEALHVADQTNSERLDRMEARINSIDVKLDGIVKILYILRGKKS